MNAHRTTAIYAVVTIVLILFAGCAQPFDFDEDEFEEKKTAAETANDGDGNPGGPADGGGESDTGGSDGSSDSGTSGDAVAIAVAAESFMLAWDPATGDVSSYEVFYRSRGTDSWTRLANVSASDSPSYQVSSSELGFGSYEFAVRASYSAGDVSEYHTSLDSSAQPNSGWYIDWTAG